MSIFLEISALLALTTVVTIITKLLKQPLVVGYILAGILVGPYALNILTSQHELEFFSKIGIVLLLFIVGLHLNPKVVKEVGATSVIGGVGQVMLTASIGFAITMLLGLDRVAAIYVAIALTFSSTIIILKLLADKKDLQKLYAKIAIGFLLVQDIIATLILIGITVLTSAGSGSLIQTLLVTMGIGVGLLIALLLISTYILPRLTRFLAQSQELLFLFSLAWGTGWASLFYILGFSIEIGALIAGVTLSMTPYADEMASRLKPLRDFFIVTFFILLGSQMVLDDLASIVIPAVVLSLFVLVGNPIIVILLMNALGYNRKTGYLAGLTVAQISEFSLILASLGLQVGHLSQQTMSLITLVGLITIAGSTYLILYSEKLYPYVSKVLQLLELLKRKRTQKGSVGEDYQGVLFGYDRVGRIFGEAFKDLNLSFLVVDFNPSSIERLNEAEIPYRYGDASDVEFLEELPLRKPRLVVSTIPDMATNLLIIKDVLARNPNAIVLPMAQTLAEAKTLYQAGASYVVLPHYAGAELAAGLLETHHLNLVAYEKEKAKQQRRLKFKS
ncbi:MAG TPA: cation:proton antiporter [Vitreimonas sp.]|nr:cation:proton antiporter [Vitreimonas sp.]